VYPTSDPKVEVELISESVQVTPRRSQEDLERSRERREREEQYRKSVQDNMVKDKQKILELERDNRTLKKQVSRLSSEVDTLQVKTKELSERPPTQSIIVVQAPPEDKEEEKVVVIEEKDLGIPDEESLKMRLMNPKFTKIVCKTKRLAFPDSGGGELPRLNSLLVPSTQDIVIAGPFVMDTASLGKAEYKMDSSITAIECGKQIVTLQ
jgi:hypothetical protein